MRYDEMGCSYNYSIIYIYIASSTYWGPETHHGQQLDVAWTTVGFSETSPKAGACGRPTFAAHRELDTAVETIGSAWEQLKWFAC